MTLRKTDYLPPCALPVAPQEHVIFLSTEQLKLYGLTIDEVRAHAARGWKSMPLMQLEWQVGGEDVARCVWA